MNILHASPHPCYNTAMTIQKPFLSVAAIILIALLWTNFFLFSSLPIGSILGILYSVGFGFIAGSLLLPEKTQVEKLFLGTLVLLVTFMLVGSVVYLLFNLASPVPLIILSVIPLPLLYYTPSLTLFFPPLTITRADTLPLIAFGIYLAGIAMLFIGLQSAATLEATRSPWDIIHPLYLGIFFAVTVFWLLVLITNRFQTITLAATIMQTFLMLSVGIMVFPIGFGYDSFLHEAAQNSILATGVIEPKTPLYIGHYVLVIFQHYLTQLSIASSNTLLLPLFFSLFVPTTALFAFKTYSGTSLKHVALIPAFILLIPLTQFILSTPQGLSYAFLLLTLFWWLIYKHTPSRTFLTILIALITTTLFIHPLTGIPLLVWFGILILDEYVINYTGVQNKRLLLTLFVPLASLVVPLTFLANNLAPNTLTTALRLPEFTELGFTNLWHIETGSFTAQFNSMFDLLYLYRFNWTLLFLIVLIIGILQLKKGRFPHMRELLLGFAMAWFGSIWLTLFFSFSELISYEQTDFARRLFLVAMYFVLPLVTVTLLSFWHRIRTQFYSAGLFIALVALVLTSVQFISYPRYDSYERVRSITTSVHDKIAVERIHELSRGLPYIVLANQSVSAAAVKEFGFFAYYDDHFFYPIPTGGPLYEQYLSMVYDVPSREHVKNAAMIAGVETVFFVLNDYWFNAEQIKQQALLSANDVEDIGNGAVTIFTYRFETDKQE